MTSLDLKPYVDKMLTEAELAHQDMNLGVTFALDDETLELVMTVIEHIEYRIWVTIQWFGEEEKTEYEPVLDVRHALSLLRDMLYKAESSQSIYTKLEYGLEMLQDDSWVEWQDEDGLTVFDIIDGCEEDD
jgi:hypothetical protein